MEQEIAAVARGDNGLGGARIPRDDDHAVRRLYAVAECLFPVSVRDLEGSYDYIGVRVNHARTNLVDHSAVDSIGECIVSLHWALRPDLPILRPRGRKMFHHRFQTAWSNDLEESGSAGLLNRPG